METEQARTNMITQQIRTWEVLDQNVLDLIGKVHREDYIPPEFAPLAFADTSIPIGHGQMTMPPKLEARLLQSLDLKPTDQVLEIGTGCAYLTALLAHTAAFVTSIDLYPDFTAEAATKLARAGVTNIDLQTGDIFAGWQTDRQYDAIAVTGSVPEFNDLLLSNLNRGGRMFIIVGEGPVMDARLIRRIDHGYAGESLFETELPALIGAPATDRFQF